MPSTQLPHELAEYLATVDAVTVDTTPLSEYTTLRVGGRPRATITCTTTPALTATVGALDDAGCEVLLVGGGSNLVVADGEIDQVAVIIATDGITIDTTTGVVEAAAGVVWDDLVAATVEAGLGGLECLSGIPGSVGATPVQNVGAYGVEVSDVLDSVQLYDRATRTTEWVTPESLDLSYRYSNLKFTHRAVVLAVRFRLSTDGHSAPLRFGELARALGVDAEESAPRRPAATVRQEVLRLRAGKGMVLDENDHDTWSAGSFFTNPIVAEGELSTIRRRVRAHVGQQLEESMPCFSAPGGFKLSAAWLIDKAGLPKGYPGQGAPARLSTKHTLALTNRGSASAADIAYLARDVRAKVRERFGVTLEPEPVWVGLTMDED